MVNSLFKETGLKTQNKILFFDGVCNLCNGFVDFMIKRASKGQLYFASLQSSAAMRRLNTNDLKLESVIYLSQGHVYRESDAALHAIADLGGPWSCFRVLLIIPKALRDAVYRMVAKRRYQLFGQRSCRVPSAEELGFFLPENETEP